MKTLIKTAALISAFAYASAISIGAPVYAQAVGESVVAIVNDSPISSFDVRQRMRLMLITQGAEVPDDALPKFRQQAMRDLIDERLKLQEAERFELVISEDTINEEIGRIAASGGGGVQALARDLARQGIDISTLREKVRAEKAWERLVRGRYGPRVNVTTSEVEDRINELRADTQQRQYLVSEICLPVNSADQAEEMYGIGMQLINQMRQGVPFRVLAQQFSACSSAARGGDLGWLLISDLDTEISEVVEQLDVGSVSRPVPHEDMLKLLAVRQKREAAKAGEPSYEIAYAGAPISIGREVAEAAAEKLAATAACKSETLSADLGPDIGITVLPMLPEREFQPVFHSILANLEEGKTSEVVESDGAFHFMMLCEKDEGLGLPSRRAVTNRLEAQELELLSRRYLRDVERDSAVEIRAPEDS